MATARAIRHEVFCIEQEISEEEEFDGRDGDCRHYLATLAGKPIGAARTRPVDDRETKIERVAVIKALRGRGFGRALMIRMIEDLTRAGVPSVALTAQCHAETFYASLGFVTEGGVFDEVGIPHVRMVKKA